jgi:hypothetical protein
VSLLSLLKQLAAEILSLIISLAFLILSLRIVTRVEVSPMNILIMNHQLPISFEGNKSDLLARQFLAHIMRGLEVLLQAIIVLVVNPFEFILCA